MHLDRAFWAYRFSLRSSYWALYPAGRDKVILIGADRSASSAFRLVRLWFLSISTSELRISREDRDCNDHATRARQYQLLPADAVEDDRSRQDNDSGGDANGTSGDTGRRQWFQAGPCSGVADALRRTPAVTSTVDEHAAAFVADELGG